MEKEVTKKVEKEINLKQMYKFKFNKNAPNQKSGNVAMITGEMVKLFLSKKYGVLC